jgi:hypothetical protein
LTSGVVGAVADVVGVVAGEFCGEALCPGAPTALAAAPLTIACTPRALAIADE